jgi:Ca2+-transporting ATPase
MEALVITLALRGLQELFVDYTQRFADFNALYGTFSSVVALMLWVYLSGSLIIFGGCICSARAEVTEGFPDQAEPEPFR